MQAVMPAEEMPEGCDAQTGGPAAADTSAQVASSHDW